MEYLCLQMSVIKPENVTFPHVLLLHLCSCLISDWDPNRLFVDSRTEVVVEGEHEDGKEGGQQPLQVCWAWNTELQLVPAANITLEPLEPR